MLTYIAQFNPDIPELRQDGSFGAATRDAVIAFQNKFGLTPDGIVGPSTWHRLYDVYFAANDIIPPKEPPAPPPAGPAYPGTPLRVGSRGEDVRVMQQYLTALSRVFPSIPALTADGIFGPVTESAVLAFQRQFGLTVDGIIGPSTWNAIVAQYNNLQNIGPAYPGTPLRRGDRGENVRMMQRYLNALSRVFPSIPALTADGIFGPVTESAVLAFQRQFGLVADGIIGPITWNAIVTQYNNLQTTAPPQYITYTVVAGDTLWRLAQRFGTTVGAIKSLNNLTSDLLRIGQQLKIPSAAGAGQLTIVIDAGHGGSDFGAVNGARFEKDDNLAMALAVQQRLQEMGQKVIMTRSTDVFIPLDERSEISNRNNADIFVSIHRNASTNPAAGGIETYVQNGADPITVRYAQNVHGEIINAGMQRNGGVRHGNYAVLRNTRSPAMMLELGYITNDVDNQLFDQNFGAYADAITRGILTSLSETYPPSARLPYFNYTVQSGDNLWSIAQRYGTTMDAIITLNNLTDTVIVTGQILKIPNEA
jgi:N-acetylmuramoyl-L-alanine amidase